MDLQRAKEIVITLASGVDPTTGEVLPDEHVCNNAEVVRAFYTVVMGAKIDKKEEKPKGEKEKKKAENSGKPWSVEDDEILKDMYTRGMKISEIKKYFGRSYGSIESRLVKYGLLEKRFVFWRYLKK